MGLLGKSQGEVDEGGGEGVEGCVLFGGIEGKDAGFEGGGWDEGEAGWAGKQVGAAVMMEERRDWIKIKSGGDNSGSAIEAGFAMTGLTDWTRALK